MKKAKKKALVKGILEPVIEVVSIVPLAVIATAFWVEHGITLLKDWSAKQAADSEAFTKAMGYYPDDDCPDDD